jgi:hypothetical protein
MAKYSMEGPAASKTNLSKNDFLWVEEAVACNGDLSFRADALGEASGG